MRRLESRDVRHSEQRRHALCHVLPIALTFIPTSRELKCEVDNRFDSSHLLCEIHVLLTTWALGRSATPLSRRAASRCGTQFTHERRPVPRAGGACGQWRNPACSDPAVPTQGVCTAKSCRTTTRGGWCALCRRGHTVGGASKRNSPWETVLGAPCMRWRKL